MYIYRGDVADALDAFSGSDEPGDRVAGAGGAGGAQGRSLAPTNISRDIRSNGQAPRRETNNRSTSKVEIQVVLLLQAQKKISKKTLHSDFLKYLYLGTEL
jgi:hypothetical protein